MRRAHAGQSRAGASQAGAGRRSPVQLDTGAVGIPARLDTTSHLRRGTRDRRHEWRRLRNGTRVRARDDSSSLNTDGGVTLFVLSTLVPILAGTAHRTTSHAAL